MIIVIVKTTRRIATTITVVAVKKHICNHNNSGFLRLLTKRFVETSNKSFSPWLYETFEPRFTLKRRKKMQPLKSRVRYSEKTSWQKELVLVSVCFYFDPEMRKSVSKNCTRVEKRAHASEPPDISALRTRGRPLRATKRQRNGSAAQRRKHSLEWLGQQAKQQIWTVIHTRNTDVTWGLVRAHRLLAEVSSFETGKMLLASRQYGLLKTSSTPF